jgi:hypothetical protein
VTGSGTLRVRKQATRARGRLLTLLLVVGALSTALGLTARDSLLSRQVVVRGPGRQVVTLHPGIYQVYSDQFGAANGCGSDGIAPTTSGLLGPVPGRVSRTAHVTQVTPTNDEFVVSMLGNVLLDQIDYSPTATVRIHGDGTFWVQCPFLGSEEKMLLGPPSGSVVERVLPFVALDALVATGLIVLASKAE